MSIPFFQRWIRPGATATYRFQLSGKDLDSEIVIRQLPLDGAVNVENMTIQAMDPDGAPFGEEPPPEPEASALRSWL